MRKITIPRRRDHDLDDLFESPQDNSPFVGETKPPPPRPPRENRVAGGGGLRAFRLKRNKTKTPSNSIKRRKMFRDMKENDLIQRYLGIDDDGVCLRHPESEIVCCLIEKDDNVERFENVHICESCNIQKAVRGNKGRASVARKMVDVVGNIKQIHGNQRQWTSQESEYGENIDEEEEGGGRIEDVAKWKENVSQRVAQVMTWDGSSSSLKCNPIYAKYFRMINQGILLKAVKEICDRDGWDSRVLDLNPERPLRNQIWDSRINMTDEEKEDLMWLVTGQGKSKEDLESEIPEAVDLIYQAYYKYLAEIDRKEKTAMEREAGDRGGGGGGGVKQFAKGKMTIISNRVKQHKARRDSRLKLASDELERYTIELKAVEQALLGTYERSSSLIAQIEALQKQVEEKGRVIDRLSQKLDMEKTSRQVPEGITVMDTGEMVEPEAHGDEDEDSSSSSSIQPPWDDEGPIVSIGDKVTADDQHKNNKKKKRRKRRKSKPDREPNLDPEFLKSKFKEGIRKLVTINRFFQEASSLSINAEALSYQKRRTTMGSNSLIANFVIPEDYEESGEFIVDDKPREPSRRGLMKTQSILYNSQTKMDVPRTVTTKVKWKSDDELLTIRPVPILPKDHFYSNEEIKMFQFEKFMEDNADEFEIIESDSEYEYEEEEIYEEEEVSSVSEYSLDEEELLEDTVDPEIDGPQQDIRGPRERTSRRISNTSEEDRLLRAAENRRIIPEPSLPKITDDEDDTVNDDTKTKEGEPATSFTNNNDVTKEENNNLKVSLDPTDAPESRDHEVSRKDSSHSIKETDRTKSEDSETGKAPKAVLDESEKPLDSPAQSEDGSTIFSKDDDISEDGGSLFSRDDDNVSNDGSRQDGETIDKVSQGVDQIPIVSIGDKLEVDQQKKAEKKERKKRRKEEKKRKKKEKKEKKKRRLEREENLDPAFLRSTFQARIKKLVMINRFFQDAAAAAMEKESRADKRSFFLKRTTSVLKDLTLPEDFQDDFSEDSKDGVLDRDDDQSLDGNSMEFTIEVVPPVRSLSKRISGRTKGQEGLQPRASIMMSSEERLEKPKKNQSWTGDEQLHEVKLIPKLPESMKNEMFYSNEEMKMFRFEKFMEDHSEEFEIVESDDEEEYSVEEYSYTSDEEEVEWDEETIEDSLSDGPGAVTETRTTGSL